MGAMGERNTTGVPYWIAHVSWPDLCAVSFVIKWRAESGDFVKSHEIIHEA